jgi:mRNA interferase YafQ
MKEVYYSTKAKKDLKKYKNNPKKMRILHEALYMLINDMPLPASYKAHKLVGTYKGCMECHIEGDFLLIWVDDDSDIIEVLRLGAHSELF